MTSSLSSILPPAVSAVEEGERRGAVGRERVGRVDVGSGSGRGSGSGGRGGGSGSGSGSKGVHGGVSVGERGKGIGVDIRGESKDAEAEEGKKGGKQREISDIGFSVFDSVGVDSVDSSDSSGTNSNRNKQYLLSSRYRKKQGSKKKSMSLEKSRKRGNSMGASGGSKTGTGVYVRHRESRSRYLHTTSLIHREVLPLSL